MAKNLAQKLLESHLIEGEMIAGKEIALKIDQCLMQDATGTMVMLELEAMGVDRAKVDVAAQYVDHNLIQTDFKNPDDHIFLQSACEKFGIWYSPAGGGVSHPVHMEMFGKPGTTLLGSDSHTCAGGSMGALAVGTGGLEVALALCGHPFYVKMPKIFGIKLTGSLPDWVSAKDVILEMLRRHDVDGGTGKILEYYGPGVETLSAMDRHVIANMGAELGATASVFPSDEKTLEFLKSQQRASDWQELKADDGASYDEHDEIDLSKLEPLIACPSSPGNVVPVSQIAGKEVFQAMVGSSANPGLRDFVIPAMMVKGRRIHPRVSFDINPTSRQILENLTKDGFLEPLIHCGGRIHQPGCNGCIGMGQAPGSGRISLRTVPRNFPGRSGTKGDLVYLCSPETATAAALTGVITDPRTLDMPYPKYKEPTAVALNKEALIPPQEKTGAQLAMGPNIKPLPKFDKPPQELKGETLLKMGDNISTDGILPAGTKVLPFRSNIPEISKFAFSGVEEDFYNRAIEHQEKGWMVIAGSNYGQGSSREHAAIAPRYLGLKAVIAKSYARIHRKNLINFGMLPLLFKEPSDWDWIDQGDELVIKDLYTQIGKEEVIVKNTTKGRDIVTSLLASERERKELLAGGLINFVLAQQK